VLRLTLLNVADILRAKIGAIFYWLRWPLILVMALRLAALAITFAANLSGPSPAVSILAVLFTGIFCAEIVISVTYNCAVGLLASSLTRTTGAANGIVYAIHAALFALVFGPLWYVGAGHFASSFFLPPPYGPHLFEGLIAGLSLLAILILSQGVLIALMGLVAISRVEHIAD
jgi:hypothetical protein